MGDEYLADNENTQTQTQNSQVEWSQQNTPTFIPTIWGRLYSIKGSIHGKHCWKNDQTPEYFGKYKIYILNNILSIWIQIFSIVWYATGERELPLIP